MDFDPETPYLEDETQSLFPKQARRSEFKWSCLCLLVLFLVFVLFQADQQAFAVLIPSGLRCYTYFNSSCDVEASSEPTTLISFNGWYENQGGWVDDSTGNHRWGRSRMIFDEDDPKYLKNESLCKRWGCISFSDTQQGVLTGPSFTVVYCIASLPFARLADATSRVRVFLIGLPVTLIMVLATALSHSYWMLLLSRIGHGIGMAICNPASLALIADYFDAIDRTKALSFYHFGVYVGGAAGYALSAISSDFCWRWVFGLILVSLAICTILSFLILREPERVTLSPVFGKTYTVKETLYRLRTCKPFVMLCAAAGVRTIGGYALGAWLATYYARVLMIPSNEFGLILALIVITGGGISSIMAGYLADRFSEVHRPVKAYIITITQLLAVPPTVATLMVHDPGLSYGMLFLAYLTAETWMGCAAAIVQDLFTPSMRTQASAVYITVYTVTGGCLGPILVPVIMQARPKWAYCDKGVGVALSIVVICSYTLSSILFGIVGYLMKDEEPPNDETIYMSYETSDVEMDTSTEVSYQA